MASESLGHGKRSEPSDKPEWELISSGHPLLTVRNLQTNFDTPRGQIRAVDGVSFDIREGEILGLVGESGCGKTVTSHSITGLLDSPGYIAGGDVIYDGHNLTSMTDEELRGLRGNEISMVFQEPMNALNPVFKIGWQVGEPLRIHEDLKMNASLERAAELMLQIGIPNAEARIEDYPHEFSGGMLQRAMIAMALACEPRLLIADEPTTALDVSIQAQILKLIRDLNEQAGMAVLLITHDLGVVAETCDRVAVMYAGRIVELGDVRSVFKDPRHPYTKGLMEALPNPKTEGRELKSIPGEVPELINLPAGCRFENRCEYAIDECTETDPRLREVADDHYSACIWEHPE